MQTVDEFRATLDPATLALVDALREIVSSSHERLSERIKWNAPSLAVDGDDRITLEARMRPAADALACGSPIR